MAPTYQPTPEERASLLERAKALHVEGRLEQARELYESVLDGEPGNAQALHLLGLLSFQSGRLDDAESMMRRALERAPELMRAHSNLGAVLMARERPQEAYSCFRAALELNPDDPDLHFNLGVAAQALGDSAQAVASYREALARAPGLHDARLNLGTALRDAGDVEGAAREFADLVREAPEIAEGHYNLAIALKDLGDLERALQAFERAVELKPDFDDARFNRANTLKSLGRLDQAAEAFEQLVFSNPRRADAHYALGTVRRAQNQLDAALTAFERAAAVRPDDRNARYAVGLTRLQRGDAAGAIDAFDANLERAPEATRELAEKAIALQMAGDDQAARELIDFDRLMVCRDLDAVDGYRTVRDFNDALARYVGEHPTLMESPEDFATRHGLHSRELLDGDAQPVPALRALIESAVSAYVASHPRDTGHPFLRNPPTRWRLTAWGVVMGEQGHQVAHTHPNAWLSGVYYVEVPAGVSAEGEGEAGWIEFGRPDPMVPLDAEPLLRRVRPQPGRLLLFPAYFYHRTIPLLGDQRRISVAFDVIRDDAPSAPGSASAAI